MKDPIPPHAGHDHEPQEAFWSQQKVEYNDGAVNLRFAGEGDRIAWGKHKYARPPELGFDRIIVRTKSGNRYILGDGLAINTRDMTVHDLMKNTKSAPDIVIGQPWDIPNFMQTSDVASVEIEYEIGPGTGSTVVDEPNPFIVANKYLKVADEHLHKLGLR